MNLDNSFDDSTNKDNLISRYCEGGKTDIRSVSLHSPICCSEFLLRFPEIFFAMDVWGVYEKFGQNSFIKFCLLEGKKKRKRKKVHYPTGWDGQGPRRRRGYLCLRGFVPEGCLAPSTTHLVAPNSMLGFYIANDNARLVRVLVGLAKLKFFLLFFWASPLLL